MSNYSYATSYEPYLENQTNNKQKQCDLVIAAIKAGADTLRHISDVTGIDHNIVSARMTDLMEENKTMYLGFTIYKDRKRKKICLVYPAECKQSELNFFELPRTKTNEKA